MQVERLERQAADRERARRNERLQRMVAIDKEAMERLTAIERRDAVRALAAAKANAVAAELARVTMEQRARLASDHARIAIRAVRAACQAAATVFGDGGQFETDALVARLTSNMRAPQLTLARLAIGVILRDKAGFSFPEIARVISGRGHSSIIERRQKLYDSERGCGPIPHSVSKETYREFVARAAAIFDESDPDKARA